MKSLGEHHFVLTLQDRSTQKAIQNTLTSIAQCRLDFKHAITGKLGQTLDAALATLNEALRQSLDAAGQVENSADDLENRTGYLKERTLDASTQLDDTASATRELEATVAANLSSTDELSSQCSELNKQAGLGQKSLQQSIEQMENITQQVIQTSRILEAIDVIAQQTNLLALNAAVEAARAGDAGMGFSVIAKAVGELARRAAQESRGIRELLYGVNDTTNSGAFELSQVQSVMSVLFSQIDDFTKTVTSINDASREQHTTVVRTAESLGRIAEINDQNRELAEELDQLSETLSQQSSFMRNSLDVFTTCSGFSHPRHQEASAICAHVSHLVGQAFETAIKNQSISEEELFDYRYQEVQGTDPQRYSTSFDTLCDEILPVIQEPVLEQYNWLIYMIAIDPNGYVPTHNQRFCNPLTGDPKKDLAGNRTKRIFEDRVGKTAGAHTRDFCILTYRRDTGELLTDLSVPIYVNGRHWGGMRCAYGLLDQ